MHAHMHIEKEMHAQSTPEFAEIHAVSTVLILDKGVTERLFDVLWSRHGKGQHHLVRVPTETIWRNLYTLYLAGLNFCSCEICDFTFVVAGTQSGYLYKTF